MVFVVRCIGWILLVLLINESSFGKNNSVSEMVSGTDLVKLQLDVAQGLNLSDLEIKLNGHSIELRIIAEKIEKDNDGKLRFLPSR